MPHIEGAALGGNVKLIIATILAVLSTASAAQCTSVLSIFDPMGGFSLGNIPPLAVSGDAIGETFTIQILASGPAPLSQLGPTRVRPLSRTPAQSFN